MPTYDRSGMRIGAFKIGRWQCLRQEYLLPGDRIRPRLTGFFRIAPLREQLVMPVHVCLLCCVSPIRWWDDNIVDMVRDAGSTDEFVEIAAPTRCLDSLGLGDIQGRQVPRFFLNHWNAVLNWHLKWPEDNARPLNQWPAVPDEGFYGNRAVNLESLITRMLDGDVTDSDQQQPVTSNNFKLTDLSELMATWRAKRGREWLAQDRYHEVLQDLYHARGTQEVEKIPTVIGEHRQWLPGVEIWATDSSNLGAVSGVMQSDIDWTVPMSYVAPEHSVISYHMCLRIPPVFDEALSPFVSINDSDWAERVGDPTVLKETEPVAREREFWVRLNGTEVGFQPAGQQYRAGWNCVDGVISNRDSFMLYHNTPTTASDFRYTTVIDNAFRSLAIGHGLFRVDFQQMVKSSVPLPGSSIFAGG